MFDSVVLGVDPGLSRCGFAVVSAARPKHRCLTAGVIRTDPEMELPRRLLELEHAFESLFEEFQPARIAIERVLFQNNSRTAMSVGQVSGIVMVAAARRAIPVMMFSPNEVKLALTGDGAADKGQMQIMLPRVFALDSPVRQADTADAMAIAFCGLHDNVKSVGHRAGMSPKLAAAIEAASGGKR